MASRPRVTIVLKPAKDYKLKVLLFDPHSGRVCPTGLLVGPRQRDIDFEVKKLKEQLEKSGSEVSVKEM